MNKFRLIINEGNEEEWIKRYNQLIRDLENNVLLNEKEIADAWENAFDVLPLGWLPNTWYVESLITKNYPNFFKERFKGMFNG